MIYNLDDLIARTITVRFKGRDCKFAELTQHDLGLVQAKVRELVQTPLAKAKELCKELPAASAAAVWKEASRQDAYWPPPLHSEDGMAFLMQNSAIQAEVFYYALHKDQPDMTREDAMQYVAVLPFDAVLNLLLFALVGQDPTDPKGEATTSPAPTGTSSTAGL